jgi:hypothetical protein
LAKTVIGLLIVHPLEAMVFADLAGASDGGLPIGGLERPLQIRERSTEPSPPFLTREARRSQPQRRPARVRRRMASSKRCDAIGEE